MREKLKREIETVVGKNKNSNAISSSANANRIENQPIKAPRIQNPGNGPSGGVVPTENSLLVNE